MKHKTLLSAAVICAIGGLALADSHAEGEFAKQIKARQAQMTIYSYNLGILGGMAKGEAEYDSEAAALAANNLAVATTIWMPSTWPQGSDNAATKGTRALPAIWEKFEDVGAKSQNLATAVAKLQESAGTDLDSLKAAIGPVGEACGACHKPYRAEK
ncbi:cytochrome c [Ruegeria sp. HKCCD8929]|uniref:c-type cytochrome n=1 Tax=Ruegeria sp. HKCCD8929 TaxID=2683006 RepID=UPI00148931A3|nr:cytochrome c [Ruegeria sp. HKCCD8929]